jgi:Sec-independent protein translocase protein TatA
MLAVSSWTWLVVAALGLLTIGVLIRAIIGLIGRLKELNRTLSSASEEVGQALETMRSEMDEATEALAELRRRREQPG